MKRDLRRSVGAAGERFAEVHLRHAGYRVLERNYRTRYGEIDLIAARHGWVVFCEVRTRVTAQGGTPAFGAPLESIDGAKRRQLRRMAREWLGARAKARARATATGADGDWGVATGADGDRDATLVAAASGLRFDAVGVILDPGGRLLSLEHVENAF